MSNDTQTTTKAPTHIAYQISEGSKNNYWKPIGAAWAHRDGTGFSIQLDCLPLDGRITLRTPSDKQ